MNKYKIHVHSYRQYWWQMCWLVESLNRRNEFRRRVVWATKKRVAGPHRFYQDLLHAEESRLLVYRANARWLYTLACVVHKLAYAVFPPPRYWRRGVASGYSAKKR
jgi:hypothetical protein